MTPSPAGRVVRHVVTLVSDDGAYGGPVSVATGQLAELTARGHDTALLSLWRGQGPPPATADGVPLRAFAARTLIPGRGFLGLFSARLAVALWREAGRADVLQVHAGRDLVSLAALLAARLRGTPYLVQTHGMVQPRGGAVARAFDAALVPLLRRARACLVLTAEEEQGLAAVLGAGRPPLLRLPNGVRRAVPPAGERDPDLVLYLARLHPRKRPEAFVDAAALLTARRPATRFVLHGADEGSLPAVRDRIARGGLADRVRYGGPVAHDAALDRLARAAVYVLPSVREPFPMSVLEALAAGTPVVLTDSCGIAGTLADSGAALVTDGSPQALADAVDRLLGDPDLRARTVAAGHRAVETVFSLTAVADRLTQEYEAACGG
ncbi:glycosyltransferase [Streptantibioticus silvisoli]|uniref:D-inositol 3-phosphate glycosyltransferase n=1 Tax=Streptantibioticus silvisoli TaxID=2705255 RepID=A0ABT6W293_9ACTN|nr:glycosyltransferase [Streptantibioticus silvisoli]MDI5964414.1 glycosyltransferase [Streptantibioticus silvisoli]